MWTETQGKRGANEIATCLALFIKSVPDHILHLSLFANNCPGQNRICIVASMLYYSLWMHKSLQTIELNFLEAGHTHMECDSMHASIEHASRNAKIFIPSDWINVVKLAKRKGEPYAVQELNYGDFKNYKDYREKCMPNTKTATDGSTLNWKNVRSIQFQKDHPHKLFYKHEHWEENYHEVEMLAKKKGRGTSAPKPAIICEELQQLYREPQAIDNKKYKDLLDLCKDDNLIPNLYQVYYKKLRHVSAEQNEDSDDKDVSLEVMRNRIRNTRRGNRKN